ncbi:MAG: hypothetical protein GOV02_00350 [Candidatus Aenigmarchaeota archaeon]|nr:hypothetical protein [Candidatus Aenigmarchaeota archaeon]
MEKLINYLKGLEGKKVLIATHHNADIDAVASSIGLSLGLEQLGINTSVGVGESVSRGAKKLASNYEILIDPDCDEFDYVILVDTSVEEQLNTLKNLRGDAVIDHHPEGKFAKDVPSLIKTESKSSAQLVYKVLEKLDCEITKKMAMVLCAGIVADTAHLRLADADVFKVLTELLKTGIEFKDVLNSIQTPTDPSETIAAMKAANRMEGYRIGDLIIFTSKISSHEAPAARALIRIGADVAIVAAVKKKELRISSRARHKILDYGIDLSVIFKKVGEIINGNGGGHNMAGSANGKDMKAVDDALTFILKEISEKVGKDIEKLD